MATSSWRVQTEELNLDRDRHRQSFNWQGQKAYTLAARPKLIAQTEEINLDRGKQKQTLAMAESLH